MTLDLLMAQYEEHIEKIYEIGMNIREKIKREGEDYALMNNDMKNTYSEYLKGNIFFLFQYFIKMEIINDNKSIVKNPDFIADIKNLKLCHYTSFEALNSIIESRTLKFNSLSNMNDTSEGKILSEIIENNVKNHTNLPQETKDKYIEIMREKIYNNIFSFSLTTEYDDAPQWERYTDRDTGICLVTSIDKIGQLPNAISNKSHFNYGPVYYTSPKPKNFDYPLYCNLYRTDAVSKRKGDVLDNLPANSAFIKCLSFKNEREVRLVIEMEKQVSDHLFTRKYSNTLKPFVLFNLHKYCQQFCKNKNFFEAFFDKIIIGPQSLIKKQDLQKYLERHKISNINVEISTSHLKR